MALALGCRVALAATPFGATSLRCEYQANPHAVATPEPRLSWVVNDGGQRGVAQSACQILVASSPDLLSHDQGDLWDTGKVVSDRSLQVAYTRANRCRPRRPASGK